MNYYQDFFKTGQSFEERIGPPDEFDAAMGRIALTFSFLEDTARNVIIMLAGTEFSIGCIMTVELSFRQKLNALASLMQEELPRLVPSEDREEIQEQVKELLKLCWRAEELRNAYLHSSYARNERAKITAKSKQGLSKHIEPVDSGLLLDVADFIASTGMELENLPMLLGLADSALGADDYVSYFKNGSLVTTFRFGETK